MRLHHYHPDTGKFVGSSEADRDPLDAENFLIPAHATTKPPPLHGLDFYPAWNGAAWELRAEPAPPPEPTPPSAAQVRAGQIRTRLAQIDQDSIRPARAVAAALAAGQPAPSFDAAKLATLETEAAALRAELAGLNA